MLHGDKIQTTFTEAGELYLKNLFRESQAYPCIPAITSYRREVMTRHAHTTTGKELAAEVFAGFHHFHEALPQLPQRWATDIAFIAEQPGHTPLDYQQNFWQLLSNLRELDTTPWPEGLTTDVNDPSFQYCLFGKPYFPAGFWQGHPHASRSTTSPIGMMVVFSSPDNVLPYKDELDNAGLYGNFHKLVEKIRQRDVAYSGGCLAVSQFFGLNGAQAKFSQAWEYQGMGPTHEFSEIPLDLHLTQES